MLTAAPLAIVDAGLKVAMELETILVRRGFDAQRVDEAPEDARQIVDLRGLSPVDTVDDALTIQQNSFRTARATTGDIETYAVIFDTGGSFGFGESPGPRAWLGGLAALAKTARLEWPETTVKAIDIASHEMDAKSTALRIADELTGGGPQLEVALDADGNRRTVETRRIALNDSVEAAIGADDVIVASGGARGVTARCLIELADQSQPAIVLLGRTPLEDEPPITRNASSDAALKRALIQSARDRGEEPNLRDIGDRAAAIKKCRQIRATIESIEATGSTVRYLRADVRDRETLGEAFDRVREELGAPTVLLHAAGVLADKRIREKSDEQFEFVFDTKVDGLRALLEVSAEDPLRHLIVFSSVAARTGNVGQVDYAMANETLNKVASAEARRRNLRAHALNWGPWDGGMVDESLRAHFKSRGVSLIDLDGGARAFCREINASSPGVEVVLGDGLVEATDGICAYIGHHKISHPELMGHAIDGTVVVPAALIIELFFRLLHSVHPDRRLQTLRDLRVLKGIQLPDFEDPIRAERHKALVTCQEDDESTVLELRGLDDTPHYRATTTSGASPSTTSALNTPESFDESRWNADQLYEEVLFHTHEFAAIESVQGIGDEAACATSSTVRPAIAIDAGIQLALAQGVAADGRSSLPTSIEYFTEYGLFDGAAVEGPLKIVLVTRKTDAYKSVSDFDIRDHDGRLLASARGLQMHFHGDELH